jgi:AhpD family alkylhydroperoxidase
MEQRINVFEETPNAMKPLFGFSAYLNKSSLEKQLLLLLYYRVSQINGCAYCLDMHSKDLRAAGETEQRLYMLDAWCEVAIYSDREKAALGWAEAVTVLKDKIVPDEAYAIASEQFTAEELVDLTIAVIAINSYNRMNIAFRKPAGSYQPGQYKAAAV